MVFAVDMANTISETCGCRLLTVDARVKALEFYKNLGFSRNKQEGKTARKAMHITCDCGHDGDAMHTCPACHKIFDDDVDGGSDAPVSMRLDIFNEDNMPEWLR